MSAGKILVVDDGAIQRATYRKILEDHGFEVVEAADGEEGLAKAKSELPDVIVSDIHMPKMDGLELIRAIKNDENLKYIPVICASATYRDIETKLKALIEAGAEEYFYMPDNVEELWSKVAVMMRIRKVYLDLIEGNKQMKRFNDIAVGRELKMVELKEKIKSLEEELAKKS